jgi:sugar lactone lactonase YvrE
MWRRNEWRPIRAVGLGLAAALAGACGSVPGCAAAPRRPAGGFLYAVHDATGATVGPATPPLIAAWRIDPDTGSLQPVAGGPGATNAIGAFELAADPSGRFFSLAGSQLALLHVSASGALAPSAAPASGIAAAFDPRGRFFYQVGARGLTVHPVDPRRGADLSTVRHAAAGVLALSLAPSRDGRRLFAIDREGFRVYLVGDDGALSPAGPPQPLAWRALELVAHPAGRFVVALAEVGARRKIVVLDAGTGGGAIGHVDGSPFDLGHNVRSLALAPDGARLFVSDRDSHAIHTLAIDAAGGLHRQATTPAEIDDAGALTTDPAGRYLYASSMRTGLVHGWAIGADGALSPVPGSPITAGPRAGSLVATSGEPPAAAAALPEAGTFERDHPAARTDASASTDIVIDALRDPSDVTRLRAIASLSGSGRDLAPLLPAVLAALEDRHDGVRQSARHLIGPYALQHPGAIDDAVLGRLLSGTEGRGMPIDNASLTALHALKRRGSPAAPILARGLVNSGQLRDEALEALSALGPAAAPAVPELRRLLQHPIADRYAADALGAIGPAAADALPELYELAEHPSRPAAAAARSAIERIRRPDATRR